MQLATRHRLGTVLEFPPVFFCINYSDYFKEIRNFSTKNNFESTTDSFLFSPTVVPQDYEFSAPKTPDVVERAVRGDSSAAAAVDKQKGTVKVTKKRRRVVDSPEEDVETEDDKPAYYVPLKSNFKPPVNYPKVQLPPKLPLPKVAVAAAVTSEPRTKKPKKTSFSTAVTTVIDVEAPIVTPVKKKRGRPRKGTRKTKPSSQFQKDTKEVVYQQHQQVGWIKHKFTN